MGTTHAAGDLVAGKYRLDHQIAQGGMGQVWKAHHVDLDTPLAIKFIDPALDDRDVARKRFEREAKTAAKVRSPHIVTIHDFGIDGDVLYIAMELLDGEDLSTRLKRVGRLDLESAARIVCDAAKGVQRAHDSGIVHRDLKPRNVFITRDGHEEIVKILDFGVAKASWAKGGDTKSGDIVGSPQYMSPEQVHGAKEVDHRADIWSLGVILFRALTGERPFRGEGVGEVIVEIATGTPRVATELVPSLPRGIDRFFDRALAREPKDRFHTARELAVELALLAGFQESAPSFRVDRTPPVERPEAATEGIEPLEPAPAKTKLPDEPTLPMFDPALAKKRVQDSEVTIEMRAEAQTEASGPSSVESAISTSQAAGPTPLEADPTGLEEAPLEATTQPLEDAADTHPSAPSIGTLASVQQSLAPPRMRPRSLRVPVTLAALGLLVVASIAMLGRDDTSADRPAVPSSAEPASKPPSLAETKDDPKVTDHPEVDDAAQDSPEPKPDEPKPDEPKAESRASAAQPSSAVSASSVASTRARPQPPLAAPPARPKAAGRGVSERQRRLGY